MFDIDRYLNDMNLIEMEISEDALTRTKKRCQEEQRKIQEQRERMRKVKKGALIAVPLAAVFLIGVFVGAAMFFKETDTPQAVAYYTVDVNPSLCVEVDEQNLVTGVTGQNGDAGNIVRSLDCKGKPVTEAIGEIISAVRDAGYFGEGKKYVLIGCFAKDGTKVENTLTDLQGRLEAEFGDMIDLLIVSGSLEDMQAASDLKVSAGLLKLAELADGVDVKGGEKIEEVLGEVEKANGENYCAPELSASVKGNIVSLSWDKIDFKAMGYAGKVRYTIAAGDSIDDVKSMKASPINTIDFYMYEDPARSYRHELKPGETKYFAVYAQYGDIEKCSNVVKCTAEEPPASPSPSITVTHTPEPTKTAEPEPTKTPMPPHTVNGRVSGEKVIISWSEETAENFQGYKVVASKTNPNPKYPEDGYIKYITKRNTTSVSLYEGTGGLKANTYYYFSITYLFSDGSSVAGNAVKLKVPPKSADPTPKPSEEPSGEYAASTISGGLSGNDFSFSWTKISDERFKHYKLVASYTNPNPKYSNDKYIYYTDNPDTLSKSFNISYLIGKLGSYEAGAKCYFSITVVYKDGTKIAGNAKGFDLPEPPAEEPYPSTNISGSIDGTTVRLNWGEISDPRLEGYKVMYSFSDSSPVYGESGCHYAAWITNPSDTNCSVDITGLSGYSSGATCYFSITALYEGHSVKKPGNTISYTAP